MAQALQAACDFGPTPHIFWRIPMKWFTTTAVLLLVSTYTNAKPILSSTIPTAFQGDWINIAASKARAKACHEIRESSYSDVGKHYLLTFTHNSVEHRYQDLYLEDVRPQFRLKTTKRLQGKANQTYQEAGADMDFPVKRGLKFDWQLQSDGSLRAQHLKIKTFYPCPAAPAEG